MISEEATGIDSSSYQERGRTEQALFKSDAITAQIEADHHTQGELEEPASEERSLHVITADVKYAEQEIAGNQSHQPGYNEESDRTNLLKHSEQQRKYEVQLNEQAEIPPCGIQIVEKRFGRERTIAGQAE